MLRVCFPKEFVRKDDLYCEVERELISKIYKPLDLGAQFDRMSYQNYDKIHEFIKEKNKLKFIIWKITASSSFPEPSSPPADNHVSKSKI